VYSRKVEYLYSLIYNALDLLAAQSKKGKKVRCGKLADRVCGAASWQTACAVLRAQSVLLKKKKCRFTLGRATWTATRYHKHSAAEAVAFLLVQNTAADAGGDADAAALEEEAAEEFLLLDDVVAEVRANLPAATLQLPRAISFTMC
jgi:hypothetical protein